MNKLEYILSGTSYLRINTSNIEDNSLTWYDDIIKKMKTQTNHGIGMLFNAHTEANFGKNLKRLKSLDSLHADSGGLQILTQGLNITSEMRDKIYRAQAAYATMGMCFDEIPVRLVNKTSDRNDVAGRIFDINILEPMARKTGKNITRQIEIFLEEKTQCKPILIAQGNCYDTYLKWVDYVLDEIPQDMRGYIGGVAMGSGALGRGTLEDVERAFIYSHLNIEKKHLHVLGIGSVKRMLPYICFMRNGIYEDSSISYDSTTQSCGIDLGTYFADRAVVFTRTYSTVYDRMHKDMMDLSGLDISAAEFFKILNTSMGKYEEGGGDKELFRKVRFSKIMKSVLNLCQVLDGIAEDGEKLSSYIALNQDLMPLNGLKDVKTYNDFKRWFDTVGRYVKSNRVKCEQVTTLEDMFV